MGKWLDDVLSGKSGYESELVAFYSQQLLDLARRQLPVRVRQRVDEEDIVQSVYRSFFRRLNEGQFHFEESHDIWRLLATMTYHKVRDVIKFHMRECRDIRREQGEPPNDAREPVGPVQVGGQDIDTLFDHLDRLLQQLNDEQREVVVRRLEGDSIEEIAGRLACSRRTVFRVLARVQELAGELLEAAS